MNYYAIQLNGVQSRDDMRSSISAASSTMFCRDAVVCPKPRRLSSQAELSDSKAGSELLEIFLAKDRNGSCINTSMTQLGSSSSSLSPPFFSGSPPIRVSNPLIQDSLFREEKLLPLPVTSSAKGGCVRSNFGNKPVVRIEGFDCLDRDRSRNCRIPTLA